jgi:Uma2 family endonuclease
MSVKEQNKQSPLEPRKYTLQEYFDFEYSSEFKHEYHDGTIVKMAYTSESHGIIVHNLNFLLGSCLRDKDCNVFSSDRMLYVKQCNKVYYPDVLVVCGETEYYKYSKNMQATLNPSILIEVLSDSTEDEDRRNKMRCYRHIQSLKQYILVAQDEKFIEVIQKTENEKWTTDIFDTNDDVLKIGDYDIPLSEIYWKVEFPTPERASE